MPAPPAPFVPPEHHGRLVVMAMLVHTGRHDAGGRAVAPFQALATPIADMLRPMSYAELFPPAQGEYHPVAAMRTMFLDRFDRRAAETIVAGLEAATAPMAVTQLRVLGGEMARVPAEASAFAHRRSRMLVNVVAMYARPEERPVQQAWVDGLTAALGGLGGGAYAGFLADEGETRVRSAYPGPTWDRLAEIKGRYDPTNLFRLNQNVPAAPSARAAA
jgi:hypothetical protein